MSSRATCEKEEERRRSKKNCQYKKTYSRGISSQARNVPSPPTHTYPPTSLRLAKGNALIPLFVPNERIPSFRLVQYAQFWGPTFLQSLSRFRPSFIGLPETSVPLPHAFFPAKFTHTPFSPLIPPPTPWSGLFTSLRPRLLVLGWRRRETCWRSGRSPPKSLKIPLLRFICTADPFFSLPPRLLRPWGVLVLSKDSDLSPWRTICQEQKKGRKRLEAAS